MKFLRILTTLAVASALGLALGFALRLKTRVTKAPHVQFGATASPLALARLHRIEAFGIRHPVPATSALAEKLEKDISISAGVTRWLYWLEAIENARASDFPPLARLAEGNPAITKLVVTRWAELYPRHLFDTIRSQEKAGDASHVSAWARILFLEWPKSDPEAAIAALSDASGLGNVQEWRGNVVDGLLDHDVERGLRVMSDWHIENYGPRMNEVAKWAAANPAHAAEFALAHPAGYASSLVMETIGKEWSKSDPAGALNFALSNFGELGSELGRSVLSEWAGRKLGEAAAWLASTDERTRNRFSPNFVEAWAKQDAASALNWCDENLTGSTRAQAISGVLKGAAERDVSSASVLVLEMNPSPARSEAALSVARKWFPDTFTEKPVPPEAIQWLKQLDPDSIRRVLDRISWGWSEGDPKGMAEFLASAGTDQVPSNSYALVARKLARLNPEEAIQWAGHLPPDQQTAAGSAAFTEWRASQPDTSMKWLADLPAADPRHNSFFESAIRNLAFGPQAAEQLTAMTDADRLAARPIIDSMGLPADRRAKLLEALKAR